MHKECLNESEETQATTFNAWTILFVKYPFLQEKILLLLIFLQAFHSI